MSGCEERSVLHLELVQSQTDVVPADVADEVQDDAEFAQKEQDDQEKGGNVGANQHRRREVDEVGDERRGWEGGRAGQPHATKSR